LAAGVPLVATSEVGAIEGVDRAVVAEVAPGDVAGMAYAIEAMLERLRADPDATRALAHAEAERLFASQVVCGQISDALEALALRTRPSSAAPARTLDPGAAIED
jgi:hypothetical protein